MNTWDKISDFKETSCLLADCLRLSLRLSLSLLGSPTAFPSQGFFRINIWTIFMRYNTNNRNSPRAIPFVSLYKCNLRSSSQLNLSFSSYYYWSKKTNTLPRSPWQLLWNISWSTPTPHITESEILISKWM